MKNSNASYECFLKSNTSQTFWRNGTGTKTTGVNEILFDRIYNNGAAFYWGFFLFT